MKLLTILVVAACLLTAATVSLDPVNVNASTAHIGERTVITPDETDRTIITSDPNSENAAVSQSTRFTQDFTEREGPALQLQLNLETPGGQTITQDIKSSEGSESSATYLDWQGFMEGGSVGGR